MSFYRIYRPQVLEEIDNQAVREQLFLFLAKAKKDLPHAFFLSGPKGTGKTTAARMIAKLFNCEKLGETGPCGTCNQCKSIAKCNNIDVLEVDAASNRGIDEIRELRQGIQLAPVSAPYKIYIIDEVHMLTSEAFNALLKTLEEPPAHAVFVLATTDPQKVLGTIQSRCQRIVFGRAQEEALLHALGRIVKKEKIKISADALLLMVKYADGSFRDAVKLLEQASFHKGMIDDEVVRHYLSASDENEMTAFLASLTNRKTKEALQCISTAVENGMDIRTFVFDCLRMMHRMLVDITLGKPCEGWTTQSLTDVIRRFSNAYGEMKTCPIPELPLELAVVEYGESRGDDNSKSDPVTTEKREVKEGDMKHKEPKQPSGDSQASINPPSLGLLTLEKLTEHWPDFIASTKPYNHSVAGVLRSSRPKRVSDGVVTIEAFYRFHQEKLSEAKTKDVLSQVLKKLFGEKVKVEIVLGEK